jgi:hypothetical protein
MKAAKVNAEGQLTTNSVTETIEHYVNTTKGRAWVVPVVQTPTGANDYFYYMKNTGTVPLIIDEVDYRVASAEQVKVYIGVDGSTTGGTAIVPINANTGFTAAPSATVEGGNDITGLTSGFNPYHLYWTSTETKKFNFAMDLVLSPGGTLALQCVTGSILINLSIMFYESEV